MAKKHAKQNKNDKSELQIRQEIEAFKASIKKEQVGYPKTYTGVFIAVIQFDEHTCRCVAQAPDRMLPKLWISPNTITERDIKNFINEHDEHMLCIYHEMISRTDNIDPTDAELCELGNQALHYNMAQKNFLGWAYEKPSAELINKGIEKELSNIKKNNKYEKYNL